MSRVLHLLLLAILQWPRTAVEGRAIAMGMPTPTPLPPSQPSPERTGMSTDLVLTICGAGCLFLVVGVGCVWGWRVRARRASHALIQGLAKGSVEHGRAVGGDILYPRPTSFAAAPEPTHARIGTYYIEPPRIPSTLRFSSSTYAESSADRRWADSPASLGGYLRPQPLTELSPGGSPLSQPPSHDQREGVHRESAHIQPVRRLAMAVGRVRTIHPPSPLRPAGI